MGGRASVQDSASTYMRSMLMELKKPHTSDIVPVFRLIKAKRKSKNDVNDQVVTGEPSPRMQKVQLLNLQQVS